MPNVLADRHHSGLYHSLQLMAARFGWTLYTPAGMDWWHADYWEFGRSTYGDDRLAQQFLMADPGPDGEFPDWDVPTVTLTEAQGMEWAYVIASVPDNEPGFARFASEHGAKFVMQVGNTGQWVDWSRDPLVLSSSEFMPIEGRGVVYHQEMDPVAFDEPSVGARGRIRSAASFVNCMTSMGACWDLVEEAYRKGLPVAVYGIDSPYGRCGIIKPYRRLVELMGIYGWGWHDKAQGDGFGHVIHTWAAVGRPLIGHASHYADRMAERFWQDGVTCIDLDRHTIPETVEMVRTMTPERHEEMCLAIRAEFDAIDWDGEAEAIRALLA
jgi:hypothetical protein